MLEQVRHKNLGKAKKTAYDIPLVRQSKTTSEKGDKAEIPRMVSPKAQMMAYPTEAESPPKVSEKTSFPRVVMLN
jgi:hypothetical protein